MMIAAEPVQDISSTGDALKPESLKQPPTQESLIDLENEFKLSDEMQTSDPSILNTKVTKVASTTTVPGKNALLARVQAAQQRARMAQEKQKQTQTESEESLKSTNVSLSVFNEGQEGNLMTEVKDPPQAIKDESQPSIASVLDDFSPTPLLAPLPDTEQLNFTSTTPVPIPTDLPSGSEESKDPPPSFEDFESGHKTSSENQTSETSEVLQLDARGNEVTAEQRSLMIQEQEKILKQIKEEHEANQKAIAALTQEEDTQEPRTPLVESAVSAGSSDVAVATNTQTPQRTIEIAPNKRVALHGQERTKVAISNGTAVLVQCLYCQSWMQVTPTATLMFCPVCQVVSPVEHQTSVMTTQEAMQMSMDRKLAEKIQNEEYASGSREASDESKEDEGFFSSFKASIFGGSSNAATGVPNEEEHGLIRNNNRAQAHSQKSSSWSEYISSLMTVSIKEESKGPPRRSAEIVVGKKSHPLQFAGKPGTASVYGDDQDEVNFEDDEESSLLPGLVAESKPLFSCVMDSVSNVLTGQNEVPDGELHGVDTSSLLTVSGVSRGGKDDGRGKYVGLNS